MLNILFNTLKKILKKRGYVSVSLDTESIKKLKEFFQNFSEGCENNFNKMVIKENLHITIEHEPNIFLYFFKYKKKIGSEISVEVTNFVFDDCVSAFIVDCPLSVNNIPHISYFFVEKNKDDLSASFRKVLDNKRSYLEINPFKVSGKICFVNKKQHNP